MTDTEPGMQRIDYPLNHEWHVAVNRHADEWRKAGKEWNNMRFMYEAKTMADEVPRMVTLFRQEREGALPNTHQQCSMQAPVPVNDNHLTCCKGVKTRECPHLLALTKIEHCTLPDIDTAKAWTCAAHIVSTGGDRVGEGYMLRVDDRMFWDNVHANLAQEGETEMTDLELLKACAERMGYKLEKAGARSSFDNHPLIADCYTYNREFVSTVDGYNPIMDDAQAMALVKKFRIECTWVVDGRGYWQSCYWNDADTFVHNADLNRAIVECVARMPK